MGKFPAVAWRSSVFYGTTIRNSWTVGLSVQRILGLGRPTVEPAKLLRLGLFARRGEGREEIGGEVMESRQRARENGEQRQGRSARFGFVLESGDFAPPPAPRSRPSQRSSFSSFSSSACRSLKLSGFFANNAGPASRPSSRAIPRASISPGRVSSACWSLALSFAVRLPTGFVLGRGRLALDFARRPPSRRGAARRGGGGVPDSRKSRRHAR